MKAAERTSTLPRIKHARRNRILDAAERTFSSLGLKATTMEAIAEAAQVSKATLYAYFSSKDEVFEAVSTRLAERLRDGVLAALDGCAPLMDRVSQALIAKHGPVFDIVIRSPNASELLATRHHQTSAIFAAADEAIEHAITAALSDADITNPEATARLIFHASIGIGENARLRSELEHDLRHLVSAVLG